MMRVGDFILLGLFAATEGHNARRRQALPAGESAAGTKVINAGIITVDPVEILGVASI